MDDRLAQAICAALLVAVAVQNVTLSPSADGSGAKPYHLVLLVLLASSLAGRGPGWRLPPLRFTLAISVAVVVSLVDSLAFGVTGSLANYMVLFALVATFMNAGSRLKAEQWEHVARVGSAIVMAAVVVNLALQRGAVLAFLSSPGYHPEVATLLGGGVNLEATWLALFGVFYRWDLKGAAYLGLCAAVSALYLSRVGMVLCAVSALYVFLKRSDGEASSFRVIALVVFAAVVAMALLRYGGSVVDRFSTIGDDNGTRGRMQIWQHIAAAFDSAPLLGHGAGNAMVAVSNIAGMAFMEDNLHNYYAQVLVDFGAVGAIMLLYLVARLVGRIRGDGATPFNMALVLYLVAAFIQFRGGESMLGFFIAAYYCSDARGQAGGCASSQRLVNPIRAISF